MAKRKPTVQERAGLLACEIRRKFKDDPDVLTILGAVLIQMGLIEQQWETLDDMNGYIDEMVAQIKTSVAMKRAEP